MIHKDTGKVNENTFVFLTTLDVKHNNIDKILMAGRARWCIEEHFNISTSSITTLRKTGAERFIISSTVQISMHSKTGTASGNWRA